MDVQAADGRALAPSAPVRRTGPLSDALQGAAARRLWIFTLVAAFAVSIGVKLANLRIGGPQYMIDDFSLFDGGFLVWFGQAPPQHAYLENWVCGLCSLAVFAVKATLAGTWAAAREGYLISPALRDYYNAPDAYYAAYRGLLVAVDAGTAVLVFAIARRVFTTSLGWAVWVTTLFLFTYNTLWCALVGRPDTLTTLAATAGLYLYLRSEGDRTRSTFWWSAVCFGLAAGLKMHGALFTIFVMVDLIRARGLRRGWWPAVSFAATAFFFFLVADGSLLFDPLKYVKARWATYHDDYSAYLHWGQQFGVILRTTGWVLVPLALVGAVRAFRGRTNDALRSIAVIFLGWMVIYCLTRQLRGYWMLPVAPALYVLAAEALRNLPWRRVGVLAAAAVCTLMAFQTAALSWRNRHTDLNELRSWVTANVSPDAPFYILGDSILRLPKSAAAMRTYRVGYERQFSQDLASGAPFVERHLKNWEEQATLRLFDMLGYRNEGGYTFYGYRDFPPEKFADLTPLERMDYLLVDEHFPIDAVLGLRSLLTSEFRLVGARRCEGGDGSGLVYRIYARVSRDGRTSG